MRTAWMRAAWMRATRITALFAQRLDDDRRHKRGERVERAAECGDLLDQARTRVGEVLAGHDEDRLDARDLTVRDGKLAFAREIRDVANAAHDRAGVDRLRVVDRETGVVIDAHVRSRRLLRDHLGDERARERETLLKGEERLLVRISADREHDLVVHAAASAQDVEVSVTDRVERAGVDGEMTGHTGIVHLGGRFFGGEHAPTGRFEGELRPAQTIQRDRCSPFHAPRPMQAAQSNPRSAGSALDPREVLAFAPPESILLMSTAA